MPPVSGNLATSIQNGWAGFLDLVSKVVSPDWGALVALIPVFVAPLVALLLLAMLGRWTIFGVLRPRVRVRHVEGARPMERDAEGRLAPPVGAPFSLRTRLVYPFGTARTDDGEDLAVICPMCRVERLAQVGTCGNCGLVLNVRRSIEIARPAGPPPGGAAIA
jgi:hypothetical protein